MLFMSDPAFLLGLFCIEHLWMVYSVHFPSRCVQYDERSVGAIVVFPKMNPYAVTYVSCVDDGVLAGSQRTSYHVFAVDILIMRSQRASFALALQHIFFLFSCELDRDALKSDLHLLGVVVVVH